MINLFKDINVNTICYNKYYNYIFFLKKKSIHIYIGRGIEARAATFRCGYAHIMYEKNHYFLLIRTFLSLFKYPTLSY